MELYENEEIKQINGFPQYYITSFGRVWSDVSNKWLTPTVDKRGNHQRCSVSLGRNNKRYVHRLVAEAFLPNPNNLPEVDHKNTNGLDNSVNNLKWCSHEENLENQITKENVKSNGGYFVEIEEISTGKKVLGYEEGVKVFGVSKQTLLNHTKGKVKHPKWKLTGQRFKEKN